MRKEKAFVLGILSGFVLMIPLRLWAQGKDIKFEHISLEQGLSQGSVYAILQDTVGFMWFGTEDGLNRYDGYGFKVYEHDSDDSTGVGIGNNTIYALHEDRAGVLWVGTWEGGASRYDRERDRFARFQHDPDDSTSLSNNTVFTFHEDRSGHLWLGTDGGGLNRFDPGTQTFIRYQNHPDDPASISGNSVYAIHEDRAGAFWVGTWGEGLNRLDRDTGAFTHFRHDPADPTSLGHDEVTALFEDRAGNFWIGTWGGGIDRFDREAGTFTHYRHDRRSPSSLSNDKIYLIYEDREGMLWIGTDGGGLNRYDPETDAFVRYQYNPYNRYSLSQNLVTAIYEDRAGSLWIGTDGGGINKVDRAAKPFGHYVNRPEDATSLGFNSIIAFCEDRDGMLWVGTWGGLDRMDRRTGVFTHYRHDPDDPTSLGNDIVYAVHEDRQGTLWVGAEGSGLSRLDRATGRFTHYRYDPDDPDGINDNDILTLYEDRDGVLWIGTWFEGLNRYHRATDTFSHYVHDPQDSTSLSAGKVYAIHEDRAGALWVGTERGGLNRLDRATGTFTRYRHDPDDPGSLSSDDVMSVYEDRNGVLWVGTYGGGLNRFDRASETFRHYTEEDGLPNDVIYGIREDSRGDLWMSTNKGLSRFDPQTETFRNYDARDGLQGDEFNGGAYYQNRRGELFFGGENGFNVFYPERIQDNPFVPPVVLTSFKKFNEEVDLDINLQTLQAITLDYSENVFSFEFAALNYSASEKNRYRYQLEGLHNQWIDLGTKHDVTFTNLDARDYLLRVQGSNNDGVWSENDLVIKLTITPPFWQTWWFRVVTMLAILGAVLGVYLIRTQAIRTQNKRLEEANTKLSVNIAERKAIEVALREGEERYRAFVANSSEGIWRTEMDEPFSVDLPEDEQIECLRRGSRLAESNDAFAKMYGYETADQVIGKPIMEFVLLSKPENVDFLRAYIRSGYRVVDAVSHEATRDGTEKYISNSFAGIVEDGLYRGAWGTQHDITDRRQAEKEREHLISGLEAKNRELERFTYTVSHDLKSPLITIKGFLGLLSKDARAGNIERMEEDIELIGTAADKMHQLLAELLELSRIGRIMNPPTTVSLTDLAREAVEMLAGRIGERGARVEIAEDMPVVEGDRLRLLEVYQNLIDNAIKFMDTQPQPSVEIGATVNGEQVRCYVRDNGIGIDPKYHEKIFGLFDQLKANQEGTGIGLALVRRIIEVHGGQIWVESEGDGQGSTFWFTLPRSAAGTL